MVRKVSPPSSPRYRIVQSRADLRVVVQDTAGRCAVFVRRDDGATHAWKSSSASTPRHRRTHERRDRRVPHRARAARRAHARAAPCAPARARRCRRSTLRPPRAPPPCGPHPSARRRHPVALHQVHRPPRLDRADRRSARMVPDAQVTLVRRTGSETGTATHRPYSKLASSIPQELEVPLGQLIEFHGAAALMAVHLRFHGRPSL
jgi:hypothetical protein